MAEAQKNVHIDDQKGKDEPSSTGAEDAPYASLSYAYIQTDGQGKYTVAKYEENEEKKSVFVEWAPASKAGTKKAVGALSLHKKKQGKEAELVERTKKEQVAREKALDEAKKIVLTEDVSLPKARKIRLDDVDATIHLHKEGSDEKGTRVRVLGEKPCVHVIRCWKLTLLRRARTPCQETEGCHVRRAQGRLWQDAVRLLEPSRQDIRRPYSPARNVYGNPRRAVSSASRQPCTA
jgi:hypothetical protein